MTNILKVLFIFIFIFILFAILGSECAKACDLTIDYKKSKIITSLGVK